MYVCSTCYASDGGFPTLALPNSCTAVKKGQIKKKKKKTKKKQQQVSLVGRLIKKKKTFSHWPRLDTLFATQAWISLRRLPEAKASKKAVLRVRCLRSVSFIGSKGSFVSSFRTTERFHLGRFLELLVRSLWKLESNL